MGLATKSVFFARCETTRALNDFNHKVPFVPPPFHSHLNGELTEVGHNNWKNTDVADWRTYTLQGVKNFVRMLNSDRGLCDLPRVVCGKCHQSKHWTTTGLIQKDGSGFKYQSHCQGECLRPNLSLPIKKKVTKGERCHNPRCSRDAEITCTENDRRYCSQKCYDSGYVIWQAEQIEKASPLIILFNNSRTLYSKGRGDSHSSFGYFLTGYFTLVLLRNI
jgi:hypothetical protein